MAISSNLAGISKHLAKIKVFTLLFTLSPLAFLLYGYYSHTLGFDPLDRITRSTGLTALILLIISLTITPLRHFMTWIMVKIHAYYGKRIADWNWIIKLRRMIGVMSFFYACLHLIIYIWLDQGARIREMIQDISERKFLAVGLAAFILFIPLVATSTNNMMRRMGKNWRRLHRFVYLIVLVVIMHFWMLSKVGVHTPLPYTLAVFFLLSWRIWFAWKPTGKKIQDDGMETPERLPSTHHHP